MMGGWGWAPTRFNCRPCRRELTTCTLAMHLPQAFCLHCCTCLSWWQRCQVPSGTWSWLCSTCSRWSATARADQASGMAPAPAAGHAPSKPRCGCTNLQAPTATTQHRWDRGVTESHSCTGATAPQASWQGQHARHSAELRAFSLCALVAFQAALPPHCRRRVPAVQGA